MSEEENEELEVVTEGTVAEHNDALLAEINEGEEEKDQVKPVNEAVEKLVKKGFGRAHAEHIVASKK